MHINVCRLQTTLISPGYFLCRVENLYSEIQFIQDFAGTTLLTEEYGFLLTQLKVCTSV